jgi:sugar-specific transcriptional regulator TrmB
MTLEIKSLQKNEENQLEKAEKMLHSFGLSENESKVYVYLLERGGEVGGSKIAIGANLHRQYVYLALPRLMKLGLVEEIPHGKLSKYKANAPQEIEKIAKKRVIEAEDIVKELEKFSKVGHEQDFEVLVGDKAIQKYEVDWVKSVKEHEEQYIIGGNTKGFAKMMGDALDEYLIGESRKKITTYYLGHTSEMGLWKESVLSQNDLRAKFMDTLPIGVSHFVVRKGHVAFFTFLEPSLLYVIKSEAVAENYKQFFMMLWEMAGENAEKQVITKRVIV